MPELISFSHCPACNSESVYPALSAKDYTVSGELFEIWHCDDCSLRFTQPIPAADKIGAYYQSAGYISHSDTAKGLINRLYHFVRTHSLQTKRKLLQQATGKQKATLLDIGAGTGAFVHTMKQAGWEVTGLEPEENARKVAFDKYGIQLVSPDHLFQLGKASLDAITLWHALEHVHDLHGYFEQFYYLLKRGGSLVIAAPNYTSYDAKAYKEYWAAYDVPRHLYHFSPKSMELLGDVKGFWLADSKPMWFDSFYVSMLSEKYRHESGNLIGALWNGLLSNIKAIFNKESSSSVIYIFTKK
ncbi:MAG: class I SAM-dependent methyltransferase [Chitinophagaceae bacterium]|nr:class I SAM-dependent methyltransferase [Chitinophagaceae bacterium]MDP3666949.1 class I SAM-dependent methyltransferase [Sediminibacterium sp.]